MCCTRQRLRDAISGRELSGAQTLYLVVDARAKFERAHSMWRERASVHEFLPRAFDPPGRGNAPRGSRPAGGILWAATDCFSRGASKPAEHGQAQSMRTRARAVKGSQTSPRHARGAGSSARKREIVCCDI